MPEWLSSHPRQEGNLKPNKLMELAFHTFLNQYEPDTNPNGIVALAVAENKLMHPEICEHINKHSKMAPWLLTNDDRFTGLKALKVALAKFINGHFAQKKVD